MQNKKFHKKKTDEFYQKSSNNLKYYAKSNQSNNLPENNVKFDGSLQLVLPDDQKEDPPSKHSSKSSSEPLSDSDLKFKKSEFCQFTGHRFLRSDFTALPFYKIIDENTPVKLNNLIMKSMKKPKFIIAPDGFVPNSEIRTFYPHLTIGDVHQKPKKDLKKEKHEQLIKEIMGKYLQTGEKADMRSLFKKRINKSKRKQHFSNLQNDLVTMNNEVIDNFNFELEKAKSEASEEGQSLKEPIIKRKRLRIPSVPKQKSSVRLEEHFSTKITESTEHPEAGSTGSIDIDILEKLERQIEEYENYGNRDNKQVQERILKDKLLRITEKEFQMLLEKLEKAYVTKKEMYKNLMLILNKNRDASSAFEKIIENRQTRLGFLNTLTDPHHLFAYLLQFYENKICLLDDIHDVLNGINLATVEKLISLCGQKYCLQDFLSAFVTSKNYALTILSEKISNFSERSLTLEKGLREIYTESVIFNVFMSSREDAEMFFQYILQCRVKEIAAIMDQIKMISLFHEKIESTATSFASKSEISHVARSSIKQPIKPLTVVSTEIPKKSTTPVLPALPAYNEESWKIMMSQYLAQMISNIAPSGKVPGVETKIEKIEDLTFQGLMKETNYMHQEVLRLLKVYLNNNVESAQKLLNGLVAEDDLAYQATIELIGEKEAMQIIKSMRLKQAKLIEKIMQLHGNKEEIEEARIIFNSMLNNLPPALSKNLGKWLEAEKVEAKDLKRALNVFTNVSEKSESSDELLEVIDDVSKEFFSKIDGRKNRFSIMETIGPSYSDYIKPMEYNSEDSDEGFTEKLPLRHSRISIGYKGFVTEKDATLNTPSHEITEITNVEVKIADKKFSSFKAKLYSFPDGKVVDKITKGIVKSIQKKITQEEQIEPEIVDKEQKEVELVEELIEKASEIGSDKSIYDDFEPEVEPDNEYAETLNNLAISLNLETDLDKIQEIASEIINFANITENHRKSNAVLTVNLMGKLISLITEESKIESRLEPQESKKVSIKSDEVNTTTIHSTVDTETETDFAEAIKLSYLKQKKIEQYIEILKKLEIASGLEYEKLMKDKKNACSLYPPEVRNQLKILSDMGIHCFQPYKILSPKVDTIIREKIEEKHRHRISSVKVEPVSKTEFKYSKSNLTGLIEDPMLRRISTDIFELSTDSSPNFEKVPETILEEIKQSRLSEEKIVIPEKPPYFLRDALVLKPKLFDAEILQPRIEGEEDNVIVKDDKSLDYEVGEAQFFKMAEFGKHYYPKNPYYDFRKIYGPSAFYLPYINPIVLKKIRSGEELGPTYDEKDLKKTNIIYEHLQNLVQKGSEAECNLFKKTRFIRRPSGIPLNDWIKLGSLGMASNMTISDKNYKATNSRCRYQHLAKLNFHKYGLSSANHIDRADLIEYITKANSSFMARKLKTRLENNRQTSSKGSSSSEIMINSH